MCPLPGDLLTVTFDPETADATLGGHYVATIKVATSLVIIIIISVRSRWGDTLFQRESSLMVGCLR